MNTNFVLEKGGRYAGAVALATLGCKVNQAESNEFARDFAAAGFRIVAFDQPADVYLLNSCSVTHVADRKSRQLIRQARRANPACLIVATGCYVATAGRVLAETLVDVCVANTDKPRLIDLVLAALRARGDELPAPQPALFEPLADARARAIVKAQDGCDSFCSFCVIPYARGRERSLPPERIIASIRERVAAGHQEVVLTGVHLGTYGRDLLPATNLRALLEKLLAETSARRLRLSSIEPWSFEPGLLELWSSGRFCRHLHLALQSGSDAVLRRMRRPYNTATFREMLTTIRARIPEIAITTDAIVGFPGETEAEFAASMECVRSLDFALVHVFPYSQRPRTAAAQMRGQVPAAVKAERTRRMLDVARAAQEAYRRRFVGRTLDVLYQRSIRHDESGTELWEGVTDNYLTVVTPSEDNLMNRIVPTVIGEREGCIA